MTRIAMVIAALGTAAMGVPILASSAEAARCPPGQFYRVSKKICQSKEIGIKLGIFKPRKTSKKSVKASKSANEKAVSGPALKPEIGSVAAVAPASPVRVPEANTEKPAPAAKPGLVRSAPSRLKTAGSSLPVAGPVNPLDAINAAAAQAAQPIATRMVKAMYFTSSGLATPSIAGDPEIGRRAVLNLLKARLRVHVDRYRDIYLRRANGG